MKKEEIDILLNRYYEGLSTDEEERTLKDFFSGNDLPEGYETEKALFKYFFHSANIPSPSADFEERIISSLDDTAPAIRKSYRKILITVSGIAAGMIILIGSWFIFSSQGSEDTFNDPEIAYAETLKILYGVSTKLNEGASALEPVSGLNPGEIKGLDVLSRSAETIEKNLGSLGYFDKVISITNLSDEKK